jgi:ribosomal protein S18 acetylase RimI-like enzyme
MRRSPAPCCTGSTPSSASRARVPSGWRRGSGDGPAGILVLRFQPSLWSQLDEAYIAELYVVPRARRQGLGGELMTTALDLCRAHGCDYVFLGTDEEDADAHRLYERFGFTNRSGDELMYIYEREL